MATSPIATAADYADAMMSARRAKNVLFLLLLAVLVGQISIFLVLRHDPKLMGTSLADTANVTTAATTAPAAHRISVPDLLEYLVAITDFLGIALSIVLAAVMLVLMIIMLVGRLIGVSRVVGALIRCLVLIVLLFPWQSVLTSPVNGGASTGAGGPAVPDFKLPGVLYTWAEVTHPVHGASFDASQVGSFSILKWARYVAWPAAAVVLVLMIQAKSSRGLAMALGEVEYEVAAESGGPAGT
jgi:hypothetical protein